MLKTFASARYRQARARTAAAQGLVLALHDAALAALASSAGGPDPRADLVRAHALLCEAQAAVADRELAAVYDFVLARITAAYLVGRLDDAGESGAVLRALRDAWERAAGPQLDAA